MVNKRAPPVFGWVILVVLGFLLAGVQGLSWGSAETVERSGEETSTSQHPISISTDKAITAYMRAVTKFQELESQLPCHRIAGIHLIDACYLLDGQDNARILTDTGRTAQDFIDSFAASLALCDLERAGSEIPLACSKFREPTLQNLPPPTEARLHVTSAEIGACLHGLEQSHSAWTSWVSYRQKALSICETAREDHEKEYVLRVNKRAANILWNFTIAFQEEVNDQLKRSMNMASEIQKVETALKPRLLDFDRQFGTLEDTLESRLLPDFQKTADLAVVARENIEAFESFFASFIHKIEEAQSDYEQKHEIILRSSMNQVSQEVAGVTLTLEEARAVAETLRGVLVQSHALAVNHLHQLEEVKLGTEDLKQLTIEQLVRGEKQLKMLNRGFDTMTKFFESVEVVIPWIARAEHLISDIESLFSWLGYLSWLGYVLGHPIITGSILLGIIFIKVTFKLVSNWRRRPRRMADKEQLLGSHYLIAPGETTSEMNDILKM